MKFSFFKLLENDAVAKIISVAIAVLAWFIVVTNADQNTTAMIYDIPINFDLSGSTAEAYGLSLVEGQGQTVDIKVEGLKYKINNLTADNFIATPILTSITKPGEYNLVIDIVKDNLLDDDYEIVSYGSIASATFDFIVEETFELMVVADNIRVESGYVREATIATPNTITITGPESEINQIKSAVVQNNVERTINDTIVLNGNIAFYGNNGEELKLTKISYPSRNYEITIQVYKYLSLPVQVNFVNVPQNVNISNLSYNFSNSMIEVVGPKDVIEGMSFLSLGEIDFRRIGVDSYFDMAVKLPTGVSSIGNIESIRVFIQSLDFDEKMLNVTNFSKKNEPADYNVEVTTASLNNVTFVGFSSDIEEVSASDFIAVVDLQGIDLSSGKALAPVSIYCMENNTFVWAIGEHEAMVSATPKD